MSGEDTEVLGLVEVDGTYEPQFELTDLGNAKRYAELFGKRFKYVPECKEWFRWNGTKWMVDNDGAIVRNVDLLLEVLKAEATILSKQQLDLEIKALKYKEDETLKQRAKAVGELAKRLMKWYYASQSQDRSRIC
jgi:hypothetical protein